MSIFPNSIIETKILIRKLPNGKWAWECPRNHSEGSANVGIHSHWGWALKCAVMHADLHHTHRHVPHDMEA